MKQKLFFLFAVLFVFKTEISYSQAKLQVTDVSFPNPMNLNVGNVGEYVYALQDGGNIYSKIDSIFFECTANPNIVFYPIGHPVYYLTDNDSLLANYYTIYNYPYPISSPHHNSYPLNISGLNKISGAALYAVIDSAYLQSPNVVYIHIPFFVTSCNNGYAYNNFYLDTAGTFVDTVPESPEVNVKLGSPSVRVAYDTSLIDTSNAAFCDSIHIHKSEVKFVYENNGTSHLLAPPGNARLDSLRIYMFSNVGTGILDTSTFKINGVPIDTLYIKHYVNGGFNIYLVDLTKYPAGPDGHPFGINTIYDMDGSGFADALAEDSSFSITATFVYDSVSCPPYKQLASASRPNTFYLPGIWAHFNNMCFTEMYDRNPFLPKDSVYNDGNYAYASSMSAETSINAPSDILGAFDFTACPEFSQNWFPMNFGFACPDAYWSLVIPLPKGYHLNFSSPDLSPYSVSSDSIYSNIYKYIPALYDSSVCSHDTFLMKAPLISEHFHIDSTQDTIFVNYGQLPVDRCSANDKAITRIPSCIKIPLALDCSAFPATTEYTQTDDMLTYQLQYVCDTGCQYCPNILTADTTVVYRHCSGGCTSIPFTEEGWSFVRTNIGDSNVNLPTYYSTCNSPTYANTAYLAKDTLSLNYSAAYPGDQIEARVTGGYGFIPSGYANEYLQIRYPALPGDPLYLFELDPTATSYFIMHGSTISALNGVPLILPAEPITSTDFGGVLAPVEMDFSIDSAINNYSPSLYTLWKADSNSENDTISAVIRLRVLPQSLVSGINLLNLRTEFMCKVIGPDTKVDSLSSCDSWGLRYDIYEPGTPTAALDLDSPTQTSCDSLILPFRFLTNGALADITGGPDFPYEFRPFAELDSLVIIEIPKGYIYSSSQFVAEFDAYDTNLSNNHFNGGLVYDTLPISLYYRNNNLNNTDSNTEVAFKGLNPLNPCWPVIDQKSDGLGHYSYFKILVNVKPVCYAQTPDTIYSYAGYTECTQQSDTNFQIKVKPYKSVPIILQHVNPIVALDVPPTTNDYSNLISFKFNICDTGIYDVPVPWIAIENTGGYLFYIGTASIYDSNTMTTYYGTPYASPDSGAIFNFGDIGVNKCNTLIFSAYINPNSLACPPPVGGDTGKVIIRYGNICSGTLANPNLTTCENRVDTFYYNVYPASLSLSNDGYSPVPVSLCNGLLVDSLTISSNDIGTITNPAFWASLPPGVLLDSVLYAYPCGGTWDTTIYKADVTIDDGTGNVDYGWILNTDLNINGLQGMQKILGHTDSTLVSTGAGGSSGLSSDSISGSTTTIISTIPTAPPNTVCVKIYMTMSCSYNDSAIKFYTIGTTTCGHVDTSSVSISPSVDSSCCQKPFDCYLKTNYDTIIKDTDAISLERAIHTDGLSCIRVLIEGVFKVDTDFYFNACDVSLAPNALIEVVDSSNFHVQQGPCAPGCSHVHAACDTMWRGIFVHPGSTLWTIDETLIEDADTAVYAMNTSSSEGLYRLEVSTFNKNYKDIVVSPCPGEYHGTSWRCIYTCRDFDSILSSPVYNCVSMGYGGNWGSAPFATMLSPFAGQRTFRGWEMDTVKKFIDSLWLGPYQSGSNTFDNMLEGIVGQNSSMFIYSDNFQYINTAKYSLPAIYSEGEYGLFDTLVVGAKGEYLDNTFRHCTTGVIAADGFSYVNISYNNFHFDTTSAYTTFGIITTGPMMNNCNMIIDSNIMDSASIGIIGVVNQNGKMFIDSNAIEGYAGSQTGIELGEFSISPIVYSIKNNVIKNVQYGISLNSLKNATVERNYIYLSDSLNPSGIGISAYGDVADQIVNNTISLTDHSSPLDYSSDNFTGILAQLCAGDLITCNYTNYLTRHLWFDDDQNFQVWNNTMTAGTDTAYSFGMSFTNSTTLGTQNNGGLSTDNQWLDSIHCRSSFDFLTNPIASIFYVQSGASYYPDGGTCTTQIIPFDTLSGSSSCDAMFMSMDMTLMDTIARSKMAYAEFPDTSTRISKQALTATIWNRPELLNNYTMYHFNDSISNTSLGKLMIADTSINSVANINPSSLLSNVNAVNPESNIEMNLQATAQIHLQARVNKTRKISSTDSASLETIANKCPFYDGVGVYQARTLLAYYTHQFNVYHNDCNRERDYLHKPQKNNEVNSNISCNLYPNPNNGNFTLTYDLGNNTSGTFEIYNQIGMKIGEYLLPSSTGVMHVSNPNISGGLYIYKVFAGNGVKKVGKIAIVK